MRSDDLHQKGTCPCARMVTARDLCLPRSEGICLPGQRTMLLPNSCTLALAKLEISILLGTHFILEAKSVPGENPQSAFGGVSVLFVTSEVANKKWARPASCFLPKPASSFSNSRLSERKIITRASTPSLFSIIRHRN
jgi:hypothetical protein